MSSAMLYKWRAKYGGMDASLIRSAPGGSKAAIDAKGSERPLSAQFAVFRGTRQVQAKS